MSNDFWSRKLADLTTPAPVQTSQVPPAQQGAWWQTQAPPAPQYAQPGAPVQPGQAALQYQLGQQGAPGAQGLTRDQYIHELRKIQDASQNLTQEQMEEIAEWELENYAKYSEHCPTCDSVDFVPKGTKINGVTMGTDKCFACGASSSTYTSSPERALGPRATNQSKHGTRQIDTGGAVKSMYMAVNALPAGYQPRGQ